MSNPSIAELKRAIEISESIEKLQAELSSILGGQAPVAPAESEATPAPSTTKRRGRPPGAAKKGKRTMSPEAREKIAAAQRRRWGKTEDATEEAPKAEAEAAPKKRGRPPGVAKKKKGGISEEGRARIAAAQKARWAKSKKG